MRAPPLAINDFEPPDCSSYVLNSVNLTIPITFRKKLYETVDALQADLDEWIDFYNTERTHQAKCVAAGHRFRP